MAEAKNKQAAADVEQAAQNLSAAQSRKRQVQARIEQAKAELEAARVTLGYARVTAPFDGLVTARSAEVGDMASPGKPLVTLENAGRYRLEAELAEGQAARVKAGDAVGVRIDALGGREIEGKVAEVVPAALTERRTFNVKTELPAAEEIGRAYV